ncbi:MAG: hypothetical protein GY772_06005 [bacterium]|nr:hypothetical protein [bacterium]MDP6244609.1 hypothetical protein [Myxococcota bacterium]MDP7300691.1 hypothetical protein [Myxococcota bacterium]MDP7570456.1 hypothetical protein [Myxococcota bacterium]
MGGFRSSWAAALAAAWLAPVPAAALPPPPSWFAGTLWFSTGVDWSTGSYGASPDTEILFVPTQLAYRWERFPVTPTPLDELELRLTIPYLRADGPGFIIDGVPTVTPVIETGVRDGIGDVVLEATWRLLPEVGSMLPMFEVGGRVKFPTADRDNGLGTGEFDTGVQAGLAKSFSLHSILGHEGVGPISLFAHAGYRILGDSPEFSLRDGPFTSGGMSLRIAERYGIGISYDWRRSATAITEDIQELVPFGWAVVGRRFRVGPYGVVGFSNGSPDFGVGLQFSVFVRVP